MEIAKTACCVIFLVASKYIFFLPSIRSSFSSLGRLKQERLEDDYSSAALLSQHNSLRPWTIYLLNIQVIKGGFLLPVTPTFLDFRKTTIEVGLGLGLDSFVKTLNRS